MMIINWKDNIRRNTKGLIKQNIIGLLNGKLYSVNFFNIYLLNDNVRSGTKH